MKNKLLFYTNTTIHAIWTLLLPVGSFLIYRIPAYQLPHLSIVLVTIIAQVTWKGCPLTKYEGYLRKNLGVVMKPESFVAYYTHKLFGVMPPTWIVRALFLVIIMNSLIVFVI